MANTFDFNGTLIGVGDKIKVATKSVESGKMRKQIFLGTVIKIKGEGDNKSFTVRKEGVNLIGIEKIFPINNNVIESIAVTKKGLQGSKKAKLYYIRNKSKKEIDRIYKRVVHKKDL